METTDNKNQNTSPYYRALTAPKTVAAQGLMYVIGAFGFVAALAWNEAIKALLNHFFKASGNIVSLFIYAAAVTVIAVILTSKLSKMAERIKGD